MRSVLGLRAYEVNLYYMRRIPITTTTTARVVSAVYYNTGGKKKICKIKTFKRRTNRI